MRNSWRKGVIVQNSVKKMKQLLLKIICVFIVIGGTGCLSKKKNDVDKKTVKIGILHSLSGTMAISEVSLRDVLMMGIDEINASGGVLGKTIVPKIVDPASDWDLFAEKSRELLSKDKVVAVFGCWTSVSRKSVLPIFEEYNGLLFYPVQYEGQECSPNVIYTGGTPNQQLIPAAEYLMSEAGGGYRKFYLLGTDYIFPRTANRILKNFLLAKGVPVENIIEEYTPFHHQDYQTIVSKIKRFSLAGKTVVLSTINGDSNVPFYKEFANQGLSASVCPIMAFSVAEDELRAMDSEFLTGHLAAWNYYQSINSEENIKFVQNFKNYCFRHNLSGGRNRVTDDPICWSYTSLELWKKAVEKAGSFDVEAVKNALSNLEILSPAGLVRMHKCNHHLAKKVLIAKILPDGQFKVIWETEELISPEPFCEFAK
ncbi:urea ABC transporter substrate-binding protein [Candidatus Azobacteroides pseudotrichonymphae]|uniref:ABC-type urea/branched-chain amino acid transporter substrate-binding component UrtA n=1 Tax=Azobacteroides pseudotrichonymphae genomovar. CFP2 TaxID=511995 RepID=B6YQM4_AZOPC|nr:urea ABC transporter substrate-binding protein [Candidatus Azobacteroides pseudotrichonymphae]BAG83496.1 ABC-type urea/branched-chain amino acid transporter substrate-binding component UrtA [Candidatus Azobacteroides pseudotrichonymphae genomovar. CFP2]